MEGAISEGKVANASKNAKQMAATKRSPTSVDQSRKASKSLVPAAGFEPATP